MFSFFRKLWSIECTSIKCQLVHLIIFFLIYTGGSYRFWQHGYKATVICLDVIVLTILVSIKLLTRGSKTNELKELRRHFLVCSGANSLIGILYVIGVYTVITVKNELLCILSMYFTFALSTIFLLLFIPKGLPCHIDYGKHACLMFLLLCVIVASVFAGIACSERGSESMQNNMFITSQHIMASALFGPSIFDFCIVLKGGLTLGSYDLVEQQIALRMAEQEKMAQKRMEKLETSDVKTSDAKTSTMEKSDISWSYI